MDDELEAGEARIEDVDLADAPLSSLRGGQLGGMPPGAAVSKLSTLAFWLGCSGECDKKDCFSMVLGQMNLPRHPALLHGHLVGESDHVDSPRHHRHSS